MTYREGYLYLVTQLRKEGWSVRHVEMARDVAANIILEDRVIRMKKDMGWKEKLLSIAHEIGHKQQAQQKKWTYFIQNDKLPDNKKNRLYVKNAEIDASKKAIRLLKKMGFENIKMIELNEESVNRYLWSLWIKTYIKVEK